MVHLTEIECLRRATNLQTGLVLREARLAEEAIRHGRVVAIPRLARPADCGHPSSPARASAIARLIGSAFLCRVSTLVRRLRASRFIP